MRITQRDWRNSGSGSSAHFSDGPEITRKLFPVVKKQQLNQGASETEKHENKIIIKAEEDQVSFFYERGSLVFVSCVFAPSFVGCLSVYLSFHSSFPPSHLQGSPNQGHYFQRPLHPPKASAQWKDQLAGGRTA